MATPFTRPGRARTLGVAVAAAVVALALLPRIVASAIPSTTSTAGRPTIVLEHGDWADASSWHNVIDRLHARGFTVLAPPNQLRGPAEDSSYLTGYLRTVRGPVVLVGHSYGGFVITNSALDNSAVKALVYVDAFMPDTGETLLQLNPDSCLVSDPTKSFDAVPFPGGVDLYLQIASNPPYPGFAECFANGVAPDETAVLAAVQRPASLSQLAQPSGPPAWRTIPSWSLIGTADHVITPAQQEFMSKRAKAHIVKVNAGHLSLVTDPDAVTELIVAAVDATS
jgi:pimeloyl-ACP methyl ester carboxylesterase